MQEPLQVKLSIPERDLVQGGEELTASGSIRAIGDNSPIPWTRSPNAGAGVLESGALGGEVGGLSGGFKGGEAPFSAYLERIANVFAERICGQWAAFGSCECGLRYAKTIDCGREWCPKCGEYWSDYHQRRFSRQVKKITQLTRMGYLVITFPMADRRRRGLRTKKGLNETYLKILDVVAGERNRKMKRENGYFERGIPRWHWFSEKQPGVFNPHLNLLVEGGRLEEEQLKQLRKDLHRALGLTREPVIHYQYTESRRQMIHWLKYTTRATFRDISWDEQFAREIWNFRNVRYWGNWKGEPVWEFKSGDENIPLIGKLERSECLGCGGKVKWGRVASRTWLDIEGAIEIGAGYYILPPILSREEWLQKGRAFM